MPAGPDVPGWELQTGGADSNAYANSDTYTNTNTSLQQGRAL